MFNCSSKILKCAWLGLVTCICTGCGAGVFNPAFVNATSGGVFPLTPGPSADYVLVRVVNETAQVAEFTVTIERDVIEVDDDGNALFDDEGNLVTRPLRETKRLTTGTLSPANELGVLFDCAASPINIVGLGENLLPTDAAVFIGGAGTGGTTGFGIPASTVNPLSRVAGNFSCGDTVIFRAIRSTGVTGGVKIESFTLQGGLQPTQFSGPSTFANLQAFLESQTPEDQ